MKKRRLGQRLAAIAFVRLQKWLSKKSEVQAEVIGEKLGRLAFRVSKKHRNLARENIARAFPEKSLEEREKIARGVLEHFGRVMTDFMRAGMRTNEEVLASVQVDEVCQLGELLERGKGVLLIGGHYGNWERLAHWVTAQGFPLSIVVRDANDSEMNELVVKLRNAAGASVISRGDAIRPIFDALARNEVVGITPDQNSDEIFVPFFGVPCGTVKGPGVIARRTGAPLIPLYIVRIGPAKYKLIAEPALEPEPGFDFVEGMTRAINASLERAIRQHPEQYLWIHNRWKSAKRRGLV